MLRLYKAGGKPVNRQSNFFKNLTSVGVRSGKSTYKDNNDYYYQWDSLHGEWQMYNKRGRHIGVLNDTGTQKTKEAVKSRKIEL